MPLFSTRGTTKPEPFSGCAIASRAKASATVAVDAYGISPHKPRELGVAFAQSAPVTYAGVATMTAPRRERSPAAGLAREAARDRRPRRGGRCSSRMAPAASARDQRATISLSPPGSDRNAPSADARPRAGARNARSRLPCVALGFDEAREQRPHRQPVDVAGVDAGQQRFGQIGRRLARRSAAS